MDNNLLYKGESHYRQYEFMEGTDYYDSKQ